MILESLSATPVPELRSGGLGVRESRRLAKLTGIDEQRLGLVLEPHRRRRPDRQRGTRPGPRRRRTRVLGPDGGHRPLPGGAHRQPLAPTRQHLWLDLPSRPGLIGERGPDGKHYAALSDSLYSTAAPLDRRLLLGLMSELPAGAGVDAQSASRALIWRRPRWAARLQPAPVAHLLDEAHAVGLTGRGSLSAPARALLSEGPEAAIAAMAKTLPQPIDYFLVQADLTVVVPGPLRRELADELVTVAAVESAGAAMVYRVSEQSVRHALDTGRTAEGLQTFFRTNSKTPVPQGLEYLINDVARRHGQLRVGMASSFLRCDDPSLLAHAVAAPTCANLEVRLLAPTVAVCQAPIAELLAALRESGFAPAAEDSSGAIVELRRRGSRVPGVIPLRRLYKSLPKPNPETLTAVVSMLRRVQDAPLGGARIDPAVAIGLL